MTAREVLDGIKGRLEAASPGPWAAVLGATADGSELATTREHKADFLAASLNDDGAPLWVVENGSSIPAVTGDGPRAGWNAEFIAAAPADVARLTRAVEAVLELHQQVEGYIFGAVPGAPPEYPVCSICFTDDERPEPWPCPTVAAIENALNPKEGQ